MGKKHKNIIESLLEGFSNNDVYNDEASGVPIGFEDNDDQEFVDPFEIHDDDEDDDYEYDEDDEDYYIDSPLKFNGCANDMDEAYEDDDEKEERFQNLVDTDPVGVVFLLHDIEEDEDEDDEETYSISKLDEDYVDIDIKTIGKFNKNAGKNKDKRN